MGDINFLTIEEVIIIHEKMIEIGGGSSGLRDIELLHSAVERSRASFSGNYLYPSIYKMGGALLQSLANNHPFIDGNKRTAFFSTALFLRKNDIKIDINTKEIVSLMIAVTTSHLSIKDIANWFKQRTVS
ncbi:MAG: type II toxin-antitoxin system death-on-curing family toxin [Candidatus Pacebacteria bacterium]|nr:type II toxin-antitoxin system death-on-curing family toxin [Candidatus Paceibacterota bacterium]